MRRVFPILGVLTAILLSYAIYQGLIAAPTDQLQGDVYRIIYYHVPSAWTAFLLFLINFVSSIQYLVRANARAVARLRCWPPPWRFSARWMSPWFISPSGFSVPSIRNR